MKSGIRVIFILLVLCVYLGLTGKPVEGSETNYDSTTSNEEELKEIYGDNMIYDRKPDINNEHNEEYLMPMDIYFSDAWQAQLAYNRILEYFGQHAMRITENVDFSKYPDKPDYGDSFAGAYLGEDNHLVVLIAHEEGSKEYNIAQDELMKAATPTTVGFIPKINFKSVQYSYTYLLSIKEKLGIIFKKNSSNPNSAWNKITGYGISESCNCVVIDVNYNKGSALKDTLLLSEINNYIRYFKDAVAIDMRVRFTPLHSKIQIRISASIRDNKGYRDRKILFEVTE